MAISCAGSGCLPKQGCCLRQQISLPFASLERHGASKKNAVQGFVSSQNQQAVLALLKQLRVYGFVVRDVMRVLAFRNFTTEEAV